MSPPSYLFYTLPGSEQQLVSGVGCGRGDGAESSPASCPGKGSRSATGLSWGRERKASRHLEGTRLLHSALATTQVSTWATWARLNHSWPEPWQDGPWSPRDVGTWEDCEELPEPDGHPPQGLTEPEVCCLAHPEVQREAIALPAGAWNWLLSNRGPTPLLHCHYLFWCHPVEQGTQGTDTPTDLHFALYVNDKLSESKKVLLFLYQPNLSAWMDTPQWVWGWVITWSKLGLCFVTCNDKRTLSRQAGKWHLVQFLSWGKGKVTYQISFYHSALLYQIC